MKLVCPLLVVSDISISRNFYENILEQKVKFDFGENVTFEGDFAIHLKDHFSTLIDNKEIIKGKNNIELYFENNKLEDFFLKLKKYNIEFIHEIREQPWKQKVMRFYDPDGYIIEIGESMDYVAYRLFKEGFPIEKISEITYFPIEEIKKSIENFNK